MSSSFRAIVQFTWFVVGSSILRVFRCCSVLLSILCSLVLFRSFVGSDSHLCRPRYALSNESSRQISSDVFSCSSDWRHVSLPCLGGRRVLTFVAMSTSLLAPMTFPLSEGDASLSKDPIEKLDLDFVSLSSQCTAQSLYLRPRLTSTTALARLASRLLLARHAPRISQITEAKNSISSTARRIGPSVFHGMNNPCSW